MRTDPDERQSDARYSKAELRFAQGAIRTKSHPDEFQFEKNRIQRTPNGLIPNRLIGNPRTYPDRLLPRRIWL